MIRIYRRRLGLLLGAALLVFVPLGLFGALNDTLQRPFTDVDANVGGLQAIAVLGVAAAHGAAVTLGSIFYTGVVAAAVAATRYGRGHSLVGVARALPYWRLVVTDVVLTVAITIGLLALIAPALFLLARLVLAPAALRSEGLTVRGALARSWRLTRGSALRVLALVLPIMLCQALLSTAVDSAASDSIGSSFVGDWLRLTAGNLITAPFLALAIVICYHDLRVLRGHNSETTRGPWHALSRWPGGSSVRWAANPAGWPADSLEGGGIMGACRSTTLRSPSAIESGPPRSTARTSD